MACSNLLSSSQFSSNTRDGIIADRRWYHRCSLCGYQTDATTHSIPHTMLPSLLTVGVSHSCLLHPRSSNTIASTTAWPSTPVARTLVVGTTSSMAIDVPHTMIFSFLPAGVSHRRPLHPQSSLLKRDGRSLWKSSTLYRRPAPSHEACGV